MHGLNPRDTNYAILYAQCVQRFPEVAKTLATSDMFHPPSSSLALQTPTQTWSPPLAAKPTFIPSPAPVVAQPPQTQLPQLTNPSSDASSFFCRQPRYDGCAFCTQSGHMVRSCPSAIDYVNAGRATVKNGRLHLSNGQPIPNDGSGRGLKHGIDTWLAANPAPSSDTHPTQVPSANIIPFQRDPPPHAALSFEAIRSEVHMAQITGTADSNTPKGDHQEDLDSEAYDLFEVLATERAERRKRDSKPQKSHITSSSSPPAPTSSAPTPPQPPTNSAQPPPQYRYQSNAEDQTLTTQLFNLLLEGKLAQTTPAHILAASAPIRKDLADKLRTRRVETGAFEQFLTQSTPVPEPEYSIPLQEIDVLVGGHTTEAGVIDPGSQIVAIRKDLADEVAAHVNPGVRLQMEGANGATNWTLGCAKHLTMQISDVPFTLHAHVIENAPFRLLLG